MTKPVPADWAVRISQSWRKGAEAIIETGRLIVEAKEKMEHGKFSSMVAKRLPFSARTAQMLMAIASDPKLTNTKHIALLPPHWSTMYELTKLSPDQFDAKIKSGEIRADMERKEIIGEIKAQRRTERETELGEKLRDLPNKKYGVILGDPEWHFKVRSQDTGMDRHAGNHYPTSGTDEICARPVQTIAADDCVLFLWATVPMLPDALRVMVAWEFDYKSHCMWRKDKIGTGYWFRNAHELLLVGTRGKIPAPAMGKQWESVIGAAVAKHSAKPDVFYNLIEEYFPNLPKIELNARRAREGWDAWGLEAPVSELPPHDPLTGEIRAAV